MDDLAWIDEPYSIPPDSKPLIMCPRCGTRRRSLHKDHIVPRRAGGINEPSNIQLLCANCHQDKTYADVNLYPEYKDKISQALRGRTISVDHAEKLHSSWRGKNHTLKSRAKMSASQRGHPKLPRTPEHTAKIAAANTGKKRSDETIEKMKIAWSRRRERSKAPQEL